MDVVLERFNFEHVENVLEQLGEKVQPPLVFDLWGDILDDTLVAERRLFATERGWKDIKTSTIQRKSRDKDPRVRELETVALEPRRACHPTLQSRSRGVILVAY